jgi:enamine deaminase RidA (YjgF/YER057c/UK114 family)
MLDKTHNYLSIMLALLTTSAMLMFSGPLRAAAADHPRIDAGVPFFYYSDLNQAADWYENKLGLKKIADEDWVVIFALNPYSQIGLVDATGGSLRPIEDKGALLSIETEDLEGWWERLKDVEGINMIHGIEVGAQGMIEEFRMTDPGGYIVEFFRWRQGQGPKSVITKGAVPGRTLISSGSKWEDLAAYSRAVVDGDWVFVSGTVGFNPDSSIPTEFDMQMDNIFGNIASALEKADASLKDIVRVRCFLVDPKYVEPMAAKLHQYLGEVRPTNTTVITQLAAEGALIEVEVTALRGPR